MPALAAVLGRRRQLCEAACLPPHRQRHRVEGHFGIAALRRHRGFEAEERCAELAHPLDDVVVASADTEANALRMERAVAHEVTDELREVGRHPARNAGLVIATPVELSERWQRHVLRLADEAVQHQRYAIAGLDLSEAPPAPIALDVDDLDPVRRRALDSIAAARLDRDDLLEAVDVELRRLPGTVVRRDVHLELLPLLAGRVAEAAEPYEAAARRDEAVADKASGRREHRRLRVAVTADLAAVERLIPGAPAGRE